MPQRGDLRIINTTGIANDTRVEVCLGERDGEMNYLPLRGVIRVELAPIDAGAADMRAHLLVYASDVDITLPGALVALAERPVDGAR